MKKILCSIRDLAGETSWDPFTTETDATAVRTFQTICNNGQALPAQYPEDYALYKIGQFDPETGELVAVEPPVKLVNATALTPGS